MCRGRCPQPRGLARGQQFSRAATPKPSGGIRSLPSLSAWGLPTPIVALACIGNVDIQVFSCAGGRLYFIRRLQVCLFIVFHVQPISQEAKKEKSSHSTCTVRQCITRRLYKRFSPTKIPRRGEQAAAAAVTLPFLQLKLGRKESPAQEICSPVQGFRVFCRLYASEFFCEGTAYKLVSHAGIYSWCRIYKS